MSTEEVMKFIRSVAEQDTGIRRVVLFGSRARGEATERSDFDFAVDAPGMSDEEWARWAIDVRDKVPTLCGVDLVRLSSDTAPELIRQIEREGVEVYVRR